MVLRKNYGRVFTFACLAGGLAINSAAKAQDNASVTEGNLGQRQTVEPVFRVSKLIPDGGADGSASGGSASATPGSMENSAPERVASAAGPHLPPAAVPTPATPAAAPHPLDAALEMAHSGLDHIQAKVFDYTATMVKRERMNGKLSDHEFMKVKIRNEREVDGQQVPFSIYMKFLKPKGVAGREVIWVNGQNEGKILAHEAGVITGFKTFHLEPTGWLAMQNNRHPIYEAGMENLVLKLIEKAERDRAAGDCRVEYRKGAKINGRVCTMISVTHEDQKQPYEFYNAQVFIDDELNVPIRYASYDWPAAPGEKPPVIEEYTYVDVVLNVGLTDKDFDPANSEYNFPGY